MASCPCVSIASDQTPVPTNEYGQVGTVCIGTTAYTVKYAAVSGATNGENTLVGAVSSKKILVLSLCIICEGDVQGYFNNVSDGAIFGGSTYYFTFKAGLQFILPESKHGWFKTGTNNEALRLHLFATVPFAGGLTYLEI